MKPEPFGMPNSAESYTQVSTLNPQPSTPNPDPPPFTHPHHAPHPTPQTAITFLKDWPHRARGQEGYRHHLPHRRARAQGEGCVCWRWWENMCQWGWESVARGWGWDSTSSAAGALVVVVVVLARGWWVWRCVGSGLEGLVPGSSGCRTHLRGAPLRHGMSPKTHAHKHDGTFKP